MQITNTPTLTESCQVMDVDATLILIFYDLVSAKYGGSNLIMKELVNNEQGDPERHAFYSLKIFLGQCDLTVYFDLMKSQRLQQFPRKTE
jgi:hypothetical protein